MKSSNASRVVFEDGAIKLIGTHRVDDQEIIIATFTPIEII